jgi:hypothetical protein
MAKTETNGNVTIKDLIAKHGEEQVTKVVVAAFAKKEARAAKKAENKKLFEKFKEMVAKGQVKI